MNENHSYKEWIYKKRWIGERVKEALESFSVVVITGARQVGKSTFAQNEFPDFPYLSLDDYDTLQQAREDPPSLWEGRERLVIDEVQREPGLLKAIKSTVDKGRKRHKFILTGSSNLLLMKGVSESLAGRAAYFEMLPMTLGEMEGEDPLRLVFHELWEKEFHLEEPPARKRRPSPLPYLLRGFMPPVIFLRGQREVVLWWESYVKTYLERDLRDLSRVTSLTDFRNVMAALALRTGNLLNQTEVARDTRVSQPTVFRYLNLLEASNLLRRVPPYARSRTRRITKSPKAYFIDPGLSVHLSGYFDEESLAASRELGAFFENLVFLHLASLCETMTPRATIHYYRTTSGKEVDFVLEWGNKLLALECKLTERPGFGDIRNLLAFLEEHPSAVRGVLLHAGHEARALHRRVVALPWWWLSSSRKKR